MIDYSKFTMEDHIALEKQEKEYLNTINILGLIKGNIITIRSIMDIIESQYESDYLSKAKIEDKYLFNEISEEDFLDYIKERYKDDIYVYEETNYYIRSKK